MNSPRFTLIYETVHGSQAYGLSTPTSDIDKKGVIVGPKAWYLGFRGGPEQIENSADHVWFEVRKFMRLSAGANPTLIEVLWTEPRFHLVMTKAGERLIAARQLFLSKRVKDSFAGYAMAQLKRIKTHRRWLLSPPTEEPTRKRFGLPEELLIPRDQMGAAEALIERGDVQAAELSPNFLQALALEKRYRGARREWEQYKTWVRERNAARAELEAQFGYDTKHAMHLVRLLKMAAEIAETGVVKVEREDREELLSIRRGAMGYDELVEYAERLSREAQAAAEHSPLAEAPDEQALDELCVSIVEEVLWG